MSEFLRKSMGRSVARLGSLGERDPVTKKTATRPQKGPSRHATDITDRKLAEAALRMSEAKARAIMEASPVPMALNDDAQNITYLNPAFTQTFGYELAYIPTLSDWWFKAYANPAYWKQVADAWLVEVARSSQTNTPFKPIEVVVRCKDGTERIVQATATPLETAFVGTHLVIMLDLTARRQADDKIRDQESELQRWHDAMIGREDRVLELKREVNELLAEQQRPPRYSSPDAP